MGDKGCARSSGRGAGGSGRGSFVEVARSSWFPNALLGVLWSQGGRWQLWVLTARTWMRARRSECQSPRAEPQGSSVGSPKGSLGRSGSGGGRRAQGGQTLRLQERGWLGAGSQGPAGRHQGARPVSMASRARGQPGASGD